MTCRRGAVAAVAPALALRAYLVSTALDLIRRIPPPVNGER
jgi:hypothetical protein